MKFTTFKLQDTVNPNTGETGQRIAVAFDNGEVLKLLHGETSIQDMMKAIKADRQGHIDRLVVQTGEFGRYCRFSNAVTKEEF